MNTYEKEISFETIPTAPEESAAERNATMNVEIPMDQGIT